MAKRKWYTDSEMEAAADRVIAGAVGKAMSDEAGIPYRTLKKYVGARKKGETIVKTRRGPAPWLTSAAESDLYDWIVGMQKESSPVDRREILQKGTGGSIGEGRYRRFLQRRPTLAIRQAQVVARVRNEVDFSCVGVPFTTMTKLAIENKLSGNQLYNMDETAFQTRKKSKRVIAVKSSKCIWSKSVTISFHLTITACASAAGHAIPPMFILPGERVDRRVLDKRLVPGVRVTCTESGYMNRKMFAKWIQFFSESVPVEVRRPVVLVFDGYRSHYSSKLIKMNLHPQILLVCLPPNATHLFQPLDISVFAPFKKLLRNLVDDYALRTRNSRISKADAVAIGCQAWATSSIGENCAAGFSATRFYPPSRLKMHKRVSLFKDGGGVPKRKEAEWLVHRQIIRTEILLLPARLDAPKRARETIDVGGRLLTVEMLQETV